MQKLNLKLIPTLSKPLYRKKLGDFLLLYNPYEVSGITLLNKKMVPIFNKIDGVKKIENYFVLAKKAKISKSELFSFITNLRQHSIIYFKGVKSDFLHNRPVEKKLRFWVYLNNQCNFRCTYCYVSKISKRMSVPVIHKIINELKALIKKYDLEVINLTLAGGEPLLELNLIKEFVESTKKIKNKIKISIITNGSLLTEETANYFRENEIIISISLDGTEDYNNMTRKLPDGTGTYKYIKKGIDISIKYKILVGLSITVTSNNIESLPDLTKFCLENDLVIMMHFYKKVDINCQESLLDVNNFGKIIHIYKKIFKIIYSYYERHNISDSPLLKHEFQEFWNLLVNKAERSCGAGTNYFTISSEGNISFCPTSKIPLASIQNKDFFSTLIKKSSIIKDNLSIENIKDCQSCLWKYICASGCMAERLYLGKEKPTYKCKIYKSLIPFILELEAKRMIRMSLLSF